MLFDRLTCSPFYRRFGTLCWWIALTVTAGCSSAPPDHALLLAPKARSEAKIDRLERRLAERDAFDQLSGLYGVPGRSEDDLGTVHPALSLPVPESLSAALAGRSAVKICGTSFCAGVARRPLDPGFFDLPRKPRNGLLRLLSGESRPPLAGYGGRVGRFPGVLLKLLFPRQYYAHLFKESRGTLDPDAVNNVKALVLVDGGGTKLVWVKADLLAGFQDLRTEVLRQLAERGVDGVHDGNFLLHGTHTHAGVGAVNPRTLFQIATVDLFSEPVFRAAAAAIVEAVAEADAGLEPARLATGSGELAGLTRNRRETCEEAGDPPNTDPDPELGVVRVDRGDGSPLATVINFAVHGTSLPASNLRYSPDNMGYAELFVEGKVGGTALFFNGAEGDVSPRGSAEDGAGEDGARRVGEAIGRGALEVRSSISATDEVRLGFTYCQLDDPDVSPSYPRSCPERLEKFQLRPLKFFESSPGCFRDRGGDGWVIKVDKDKDPPLLEREGAVMSAFSIETGSGPDRRRTVIATMPGEPITDVGLAVKSRAREEHGFDHAWIFALANAHMAYIVTEEEYVEGGYEAASNVFGPTEGRVFTDNALHLVEKLAD